MEGLKGSRDTDPFSNSSNSANSLKAGVERRSDPWLIPSCSRAEGLGRLRRPSVPQGPSVLKGPRELSMLRGLRVTSGEIEVRCIDPAEVVLDDNIAGSCCLLSHALPIHYSVS